MSAIGELEAALVEEKAELTASLAELREATGEALDWKASVRRRPLESVGIAAVIGVGLGVLSATGTPSRGTQRGRSTLLGGVVSAVLPALAGPLGAIAERLVRSTMGSRSLRDRRDVR